MNQKIDILQFIPKQTSLGYKIFYELFNRNNEQWIKVWYKHPRIKPLYLKRWVDVKTFGCFIGQLQAEGTKNAKTITRLDFSNKLIEEHKEFVKHLKKIGISKKLLLAELTLHRSFKGDEKAIIDSYQNETGVLVKYVRKSPQRGTYGFKTYRRSTLLTEIILNAVNKMRKKLVEENWVEPLKIFADAFFSKLLTGDGTIDVQTNNRERDYPYVRISIIDGNNGYLKDYSCIMRKFGFIPHIIYKYKRIRAICSLEKLLYLYKIRAFENTNNWKKLLLCIDLCLKGRRYRTNYRFIDLSRKVRFNSVYIAKRYNVRLSSANDWLGNKEKEGLVERVYNKSLVVWELTEKAINLAELLKVWQKEFNELTNKYKMHSSLDILNSIKVRSCYFQPNKPAIQGHIA